jgi:hypothetical protein
LLVDLLDALPDLLPRDLNTAIVVNILPTLRTFTMTSGPIASFGGSAAVRARPEETNYRRANERHVADVPALAGG